MRSTRSLLAVFAVGALALSLTACGGDDGGLDTNASAEDLADAIEEATDGEVSADEVQDQIDEATDGEGLGSVSDVCIGATYAGAALLGAMGGTEIDDEAKAFFEDAQKNVPDEIKDDFAVLADWFNQYAALIEEHGGDLTSAMADPEVLAEFETMNSAEYEEATANVNAWFTENCDSAAN